VEHTGGNGTGKSALNFWTDTLLYGRKKVEVWKKKKKQKEKKS
jgi:hypothetical protein